jgi:hypothetical protein
VLPLTTDTVLRRLDVLTAVSGGLNISRHANYVASPRTRVAQECQPRICLEFGNSNIELPSADPASDEAQYPCPRWNFNQAVLPTALVIIPTWG